MEWNLSDIASALGGGVILIFLTIEAIRKACTSLGWISDTKKKKLEKEKQLRIKEISDICSKIVKDNLEEVSKNWKAQDSQQNKKLDLLIQSSIDSMRIHIVNIYYKYLPYQKITAFDKQAVVKLYNDYHAQGGNTFVDDIWNELRTWAVVNSWEEVIKK